MSQTDRASAEHTIMSRTSIITQWPWNLR